MVYCCTVTNRVMAQFSEKVGPHTCGSAKKYSFFLVVLYIVVLFYLLMLLKKIIPTCDK